MKKVWSMLKRYGALALGVLLFLLGGGWLWYRRDRILGRLKDEVRVADARREIERLRGQREEIARQVGEADEAILEIDRKLARNRRAVVESFEDGEGLSDDEVDEAFARLGY